MNRLLVSASLMALALATPPAAAETLMVGDPALSARNLAFTYAGDLWIAERDGSNPRRLTSSPADEMRPRFSPDGSMLAFSANLDGNYDVFVVSVAGGQPRRLTWHPGADRVVGWTSDGRSVAFVSPRERRAGRSGQLYHASLDGGLPTKVSEARVFDGAWNADGSRFAAVPFGTGYNGLDGGNSGWRGYRGGTTPPIQIIDFAGKSVETVGAERTSNRNPMWMDGRLYFLSDRDGGTYNLYRYDPAAKTTDKLTDESEWDVRSAAAQGGRIVYEAGGRLKMIDATGGNAVPLALALNADLPERQPRWKDVGKNMEEAHISPSGARVAITARGEVFTVPTDQGAVRNISNTAAQRNYSGIWSPAGTQLAYVEDDGSRQTLVIEDQAGTGKSRRLALDGAFNRLHGWGGKGGTVVYSTNKLELRTLDIASGSSTLIATAQRRQMGYGQQFEAVVSPDGQWLAFTNEGRNFNAGLFLYQFATRRTFPVSGDFADVGAPTFSRDGKLLFFTASTNSGPAQVGLDMTTQEQPFRSGIYVAVLERDGKSPIAPVLAEETDKTVVPDEAESTKKAAKKPVASVVVDPDDLIHRVVALPVGEAFYSALATDKDGALYYVRSVQPGGTSEADFDAQQADSELLRFDFKDRKSETLTRGVTGIEVNGAGDKLLIVKPGAKLMVADAGKKIEPKPVDVSGVRMNIDPAIEWAQILNDAWRMEREYFYDPGMHGIDWDGVRAKYTALVPHVGRREDLNALIVQMIAELGVGHNRAGGGDTYANASARPGLLGADFALTNGRYRIARLYDGGYWNPQLKAPLAAPGVAAREGDYILAVGGRELTARDNIYQMLSGAAGGQVQLTLAKDAAGAGRRDVVVEPVADENQLRLWGWIEDNRRKVDQATGGKVAYVYMPNTGGAGFTFFNRMFFAQADKPALILDDRSNGGGQAANYVVEVLGRTRLSGWKDREGLVFDTPGGAIYGPKVMLIDQDAGSGGDYMPWAFAYKGLGKLIGTRTWGGLIGISANPDLVDGGYVTVPYFRAFDPEGRWLIENVGTPPDIPVELDQMALEQGRDTQLDAAIAQVMADLRANPPIDREAAPAYPSRRGD